MVAAAVTSLSLRALAARCHSLCARTPHPAYLQAACLASQPGQDSGGGSQREKAAPQSDAGETSGGSTGEQAASAASAAARSAADELAKGASYVSKAIKDMIQSSKMGGTKASKEAEGSPSQGAEAGPSSASASSSSSASGNTDGAQDSPGTESPGTGSSDSESSSKASEPSLLQRLRREVIDAVLPSDNIPSVMRKPDFEAVEIQVGEGPADLVLKETPKSLLDQMKQRFAGTALWQRIEKMQQTETAKRVAQGYMDIKEKIEAGDSEVINRMSEMRSRIMEQSEAATTYKEIRMRHPSFDMPVFLRAIKKDVPVVIKAYLEGAQDVLKDYCSDALLERLTGIYKVTVAQGQITDSTILEYSDVDMVDMKMLNDNPVIILHFSCQQLNCVRDQYGNIVSGTPDDVHRVYYYWAVQQDGHGFVTTNGQYIPPRWKLIEMLLRGAHRLL